MYDDGQGWPYIQCLPLGVLALHSSRRSRRCGGGRNSNKRRHPNFAFRTMESASTSHDPDVEAQRDVLQPHLFGEDNIHETAIRPSEMTRNAGQVPIHLEHPTLSESQAIGREGVNHDSGIDHPEHEDAIRQTLTGVEHGEVRPGANTQARHMEDHSPGGPVPKDPSQEPRMIGDFHGSTNALWNLYGKEAKSHDEARIQPLKDDMDGVLIFAGLFSAALTSFVVDSKQNLQVSPSDKMVYYLEQHSTILSQISRQIASIAPEVSIPSTPPPSFPPFSPSASDIRINVFWFMALAFSLSAALLAILVQQWVRDYMHVFQRYSDLQKSARMRQYLYEGSEGWYMPIAAEAVPGLLHVSLFLFFAGLADSTLNINTTIGVSTTVPIGICGLLYIFITFAPVIYPQSPYQTSFSGVIWYAIQKLRGRSYQDRDGQSKPVSTNMAQGQMQLSTEKTKERNGRDKRAILWLLDNLTEDAEIESFVMSARDSLEVWTNSSKEDGMPVVAEPSSRLRMIRNAIPRRFRKLTAIHSSPIPTIRQRALDSVNTHRSVVTTTIHERITIHDFCWRIGFFFNTCQNRAVFASDEVWRMRARACVEAMASLVSFANVELGWFGDSLQVLEDIGSFEGIHKLSLAGKDEAFVVHWTCLSIMAIRSALKSDRWSLREANKWTSILNASYWSTEAKEKAREFDKSLEHRWGTEHEWHLSSKISFAADTMQELNLTIAPEKIDEDVLRMARQLPGVHLDFPNSKPFLRQSLELFGNPPKLQFICRHQPLNEFFDYLKRIDACQDNSPNSEYEQVIGKVIWPKHLLQRSFWSTGDFHAGGLGLAVELFLLSLKQLLSTYPSQESYSTLFIGTFRAITSDRRIYGRRIDDSTRNILLDVVASEQGLLRTFDYPDYITDEVWELLGDILEGDVCRPWITDPAVRQLTDLQREVGGKYGAKAEAVISRLRPSNSRGPSAPTGSE